MLLACRKHLKELLLFELTAAADSPSTKLTMAFLRRLAKDPGRPVRTPTMPWTALKTHSHLRKRWSALQALIIVLMLETRSQVRECWSELQARLSLLTLKTHSHLRAMTFQALVNTRLARCVRCGTSAVSPQYASTLIVTCTFASHSNNSNNRGSDQDTYTKNNTITNPITTKVNMPDSG